jgi:hypothetical protein
VAFAENRIPSGFPSGPVIYAFILLAIFFVSRRNEFAADAGSVRLTGDAEAMITALAKISRLNTMPIHWNKLDEKMLSHPSTLKRMARLAHTGGISEARIPELLTQSVAPPTDLYSLPSTALTSGKVFSTQFKARLASRIAWTTLLSMAAIPALIAFIVQSASLIGPALWMAYSFGFVLTLGTGFVLTDILPLHGLPRLEQSLRAKPKKEDAPPQVLAGLFVSLSPDSSPRIYEGNWAWDVGFLSLSPEQLSYCGEEGRFSLRREEIVRISLGPGPINWFHTPAVYVFWREGSRERVLNLRPLNSSSMRLMARATRALARDLENWHRGLQSASDSLLPLVPVASSSADPPGTPGFGQVTSISPRSLVRGPFLARDFLLNLFIATGVAVLFGLRFPFLDSFSAASDSASLKPGGGGYLYVLAVVSIARLLFLWPYLRFRETQPDPGPGAPVPTRVNQT